MAVVLIDSNVLLDIATRNPQWLEWSRQQFKQIAENGDIRAINQIIYAEISLNYNTEAELNAALEAEQVIRLSLPWEAAFPAGRAHEQYRLRGGTRQSPMPDFYIGAHALVSGLRLLTRDAARYRTYFPSIELICPT